jgi:hypothetical protein
LKVFFWRHRAPLLVSSPLIYSERFLLCASISPPPFSQHASQQPEFRTPRRHGRIAVLLHTIRSVVLWHKVGNRRQMRLRRRRHYVSTQCCSRAFADCLSFCVFWYDVQDTSAYTTHTLSVIIMFRTPEHTPEHTPVCTPEHTPVDTPMWACHDDTTGTTSATVDSSLSTPPTRIVTPLPFSLPRAAQDLVTRTGATRWYSVNDTPRTRTEPIVTINEQQQTNFRRLFRRAQQLITDSS